MNCSICKKSISKRNKRYCSYECYWKSKIGTVSWNKGKNLPQISGEKNGKWKGGVHTYQNLKNEYLKKWRYKNPISVKTSFHKRRLLISNLTIQIIQQVYEDNIKHFGTLTCYLCLKPIPFGKDHLEHKIPLSRGGNNSRDNLDIACQKCNCQKNTKTEIEFRKELLCGVQLI